MDITRARKALSSAPAAPLRGRPNLQRAFGLRSVEIDDLGEERAELRFEQRLVLCLLGEARGRREVCSTSRAASCVWLEAWSGAPGRERAEERRGPEATGHRSAPWACVRSSPTARLSAMTIRLCAARERNSPIRATHSCSSASLTSGSLQSPCRRTPKRSRANSGPPRPPHP